MLLASKYEEIWSPEVKDFVFISDKAYTRQQLLQMERVMLNTLKYRLTVPTHYHFLLRYIKAAKTDKRTEHYAFFLTELALVNYKCIKYPTSLIATASVYAALRTFNKNAWPSIRGVSVSARSHLASIFSQNTAVVFLCCLSW